MYFRVMLGVLSMLMYAGIVYAAPFAYIANSADDSLSVIDTATYAVSAVPVGNGPYGVTVNPIGGRVYVSNQIGKTVSVIDTYDNSVTSIPASGTLAHMPGGLAVNSAGTRLFVADGDGASLTVFNVATRADLGTIALGANQPDGVAVGPADGSGNYKIYVTCFGSGLLKVISANDADPISGWTVADVTVGAGPKGVAVNSDGSRVYVANMDANSVTVINGATNAIIGSPIAVGASPAGISVNPANTKVYVANSGASTISVIDVATSGVTTVNLTDSNLQPFGISVSPDGAKVITSNHYGNKATVFDATTNAILADPVVGNASMTLGKLAGPVRYPVATSVSTPSWFGPGGSINPPAGQVTMSPTGVVMVANGQQPTFSIVSDTNFEIAGVTRNGASLGAVSSVTLNPVTDGTQSISASFNRTHWPVTVTKIGTGTGRIVSSVTGIDCGTSCTNAEAVYPNNGTMIYFTYSKDSSNAALVSWEGACSSYTSGLVCGISMSEADAMLKASTDGTFNIVARLAAAPAPTTGPVLIDTTYYQTLQAGYDAAATGKTIQIVTGTYTLAANASKSVTLSGGYADQTFGTITGAVTIDNAGTDGLIISLGSVTIGQGTFVIM